MAGDLSVYSARAMDIAKGQIGGVFQTGLVLYMFLGHQLPPFNILILMSFGFGPIRNLLSMEQVFAAVSVPGAEVRLPKLLYIALNLVGAAVIMWKFKAMGLLPITSADWVSMLPTRSYVESSAAGSPLL